MAPPLIQLKDIHLTFGGSALFTGAEFSVSPGERVCLVGRNGSGKSTLLKIAAGLVTPDRGTVFVQPGATVRYLPQEPDFSGAMSVRDYVIAGLGPTDDIHVADFLIGELGLTGDEDPRQLSGGEARRAALARVLAPAPDILLLDEPTNHLDLPAIEWLERELPTLRSALVLISHDRRFLSNLSQSTVWLDRGTTRRLDKGFSAFEAWRDEILAQEERDQHKLDRRIVAEEHWLRYGVTARRKRNVGRLARLQDMRAERRAWRGAAGAATATATATDQSGALVIEAKGISKAFGEQLIVDGFSIRIRRGNRIGIVGPNGTGKTTLLTLLTGKLAPDSGSIRLGTNLNMTTLDQHRASLAPDVTPIEAITDGGSDTIMVGDQPKHVTSYLKDFLFSAEQMRTPLRSLSGGERGRLMLARALAIPSNLLVLDEPTNDLDMEMLDVLEELIGDYQGTVLLISHDRDFLDRIVDAVIAPAGDGRWIEYAGGYSDMLAQRGGDLGPKASREKSAKTPRVSVTDQSAKAAPARKRRLSFNEKHALETLPKIMESLDTTIKELQAQLADPGFYARDAKLFHATSKALDDAHSKLADAESRWLELEILREEIESN